MPPIEGLAAALDLQTVRVVRQIAEHGSLTAAAEALGYSQPAVSQQLRRFEERTGIALVERVGRGIRLTQSGRVLARHANAVATALEAAAGRARRDPRPARRPGAARRRSPRRRRRSCRGSSPRSAPRTRASPSPTSRRSRPRPSPPCAPTVPTSPSRSAIPGDRDDPHRASARGLEVRPFGDEPMRLVLPAGHPAAASDVVDLAALGDDPWIAGCPRCRGHLLELADAAGFTPRIAFETDNFVAVEGMVAQGLGVALLPDLALAASPRHPGVVDAPHRGRATCARCTS